MKGVKKKMNEKVILISIDGMRPDGVTACGHPFAAELLKHSAYTLCGKSVFPSVTLPCHTSMFYSVLPERHGILTNTYTPPVRPIDGIVELLHKAGKTCGAFHNWEPLRHVWRSENMTYSVFVEAEAVSGSDQILTEGVLSLMQRDQPDFLFLHMVETDHQGHNFKWMSPEYLAQLSDALGCAERIVKAIDENCSVIITADHGGHEYMHGEDCPEDMTIPLFFWGKAFPPGQISEEISILDIAPTVAGLMGLEIPKEWRGRPVRM